MHNLQKMFNVHSPMFIFFVSLQSQKRGNSSVGRALASQAEGRGFEPRLPL